MIIPFFILIFGCVIGSFLTVCIYRIPFASLAEEDDVEAPKAPFDNLSVSHPKRSFCPKCLNQLRWWHNIPVLSWLRQLGRCTYCKEYIPARYPIVELLTGNLALLCFLRFGLTPTALLIFVFCCAMLVIAVIDYDFYIIPNLISIPGTVICFLLGVVNHFFHIFTYPVVPDITQSLIGLFSGSLFLFLIAEFYLRLRKIEGLGMGDVKLLAMTGALFGYESSIYTIFIGSLLGAVIGVVSMLIKGKKFNQAIPFGPFLVAACLIYIFISPFAIEKTIALFINTFNLL